MKFAETRPIPSRFTIAFLVTILVHTIAHGADIADRPQRFNTLDKSALIYRAPIEYPYEARRARIIGSGVVVIEVDRTTGKVKSAHMAPSTGSTILDYATLSSFRQWRFKPGTVSPIKVPITFTVGGPPVFEYRVKQKPMDEVLAHFLGKGVVLKGPIPAYPRFPPWTEKHGQGVYELYVQKDGTVTEVKILKPSGDDKFDRVAIEYIAQVASPARAAYSGIALKLYAHAYELFGRYSKITLVRKADFIASGAAALTLAGRFSQRYMPSRARARPHAQRPTRSRTRDENEEEGASANLLRRLNHARRRTGRFAALHVTVAPPIAKVEEQSDQQPYDQSHPVSPAQSINHRAAHNDAENRHDRQRRHAETPFKVRTPNTHYPDTYADQNKREERTDAGHLANDVLRNERGENSCEDKEQHVRLVRRPTTRVHIGENLRHEAVATHGIEDARLTEQHHENDRGEAGQNCDRHRLREPFVASHV